MTAPDTDHTPKTEIMAAGQRAVDGVRDTATQKADAAKVHAAEHVASAAAAADAARDELPQDHLASPVLDHTVQMLGQVADHLKDTDVSALAREAGDFARRNPALVLGGAALLGFAAARFLKAGPAPDTAVAQDPWTDHLERS